MKSGWLKYLVLFFIIASCDSLESGNNSLKIKPLVSASKVMLLQQKGIDVVLIDVRPNSEYLRKHIANARNIWRPQIQDTTNYVYGGMMASKVQMEKLFSKLGIKYGDYLVLYDAKGQVDAARLWWILHFYGYKNMSLLDGGIHDWERNEGAVSLSKKEKFRKSKFSFEEEENHDLFFSKEAMIKSLDSEQKIVDCRSTNEYSGAQLKKGAFRAGHIPRAIHADYYNCINMKVASKDFCKLKSKKKLLDYYSSKGILRNDTIVIYCHSGVRSAHTTFVLTQILDFENVKNYDGSWIEWSYDDELPIEMENEIKK